MSSTQPDNLLASDRFIDDEDVPDALQLEASVAAAAESDAAEEMADAAEASGTETSESQEVSDAKIREATPTVSSRRPSDREDGGVKLFLGGLAWETTTDTLKQHFAQYGEDVMKDRATGAPRGFGFITFKDEQVANLVCQQRHVIDGRQIDAKRSVPHGNATPKPRSRKIFVGGLAPDTTDDLFREYFSQFGAVTDAQIMQDYSSGRSRGFGFVTFDDDAAVDRVFQAGSMQTLAGKKVEIKPATPRGSGPATQNTGGRGGRGGYGAGRGKSSFENQSGGRGRSQSPGFDMQGPQPAAFGMMGGTYGVGYGMPGYAGAMGFAAPYGAYTGMMIPQMGFGFPQGYGPGYNYMPGFPANQHQQGFIGASPMSETYGASQAADQQVAGSPGMGSARYHPYTR